MTIRGIQQSWYRYPYAEKLAKFLELLQFQEEDSVVGQYLYLMSFIRMEQLKDATILKYGEKYDKLLQENPDLIIRYSKKVSCHFIGYPDKLKGYRFYCPNRYTKFIEMR